MRRSLIKAVASSPAKSKPIVTSITQLNWRYFQLKSSRTSTCSKAQAEAKTKSENLDERNLLEEDERDKSLSIGPNGRPLFTSASSQDVCTFMKFRKKLEEVQPEGLLLSFLDLRDNFRHIVDLIASMKYWRMKDAGSSTTPKRSREELTVVKDIPVLLAILKYNSRFTFAEIEEQPVTVCFRPIHARDVGMVNAFWSIIHDKKIMVGDISHSASVGKLNVPTNARLMFPRHTLEEAAVVSHYYISKRMICREAFPDACETSSGYEAYDPKKSRLNEKSVEEAQLLVTLEKFDHFCKDGKVKEAVEVLGLLKLKKWKFIIHNHLKKVLPHLDVGISNQIVEMYMKCGYIEDAYVVFNEMPEQNIVSWATLMTCLVENNLGSEALHIFTKFKTTGLKPSSQIFLVILTACRDLRNVKEGMFQLESMPKYKLVPSIEHYEIVVEMLGASGYILEAFEFINNMSMEPSVKLWEIMVYYSRIHGDLPLGDRCAKLVNLLDPSFLDERAKEGLLPIKPSSNLKENDESILSANNQLGNSKKGYAAGDRSQPGHELIYRLVRSLIRTTRAAGYVPDTQWSQHDLEEEDKEENLVSHSERLALAELLLTTPARVPVRILKNLRSCGDCHEFFKLTSKLVGRSIISRDGKRFHFFKDGKCSCGDFW